MSRNDRSTAASGRAARTRVLIADDEPNIRDSLRRLLELEGNEVVTADNGLAAQRRMQEEPFGAAIVDLKMPGMDGLELLRWIRLERPRLPVIMISAYGEVSDAVTAMKLGAHDYVVKPFDPEELVLRLGKLVEAQTLRDHAEVASRGTAESPPELGDSPPMAAIATLVRKVAPTPATVLITGDSGTGKEVVARALHHHSRRSGPFIPVNCGGIPDTLLESELFGYERGAFTGAAQRKVGMFELAAAGTLFLDEIGEMPGQLQVKLLRAVQDRRIQRLGATASTPIETRLVAATNRDLEQEVAAGRFREDLYYRLNVVRVHVPPLRERLAELPRLAGRILARLNQSMGKQIQGLTPAALSVLQGYGFPGNVRELENILERAVIFAEGSVIDTADLDLAGAGGDAAGPPPDAQRSPGTLKDNERTLIAAALARWEGNRTRAAAELGITRRTLFNKLRHYGLD